MRGFVVLAVLLAGTAIADAKRIACARVGELTLPRTVADPTDTLPPTAPVIDWISIDTSHGMIDARFEVTSVMFGARLSADTELVRVTLEDAGGHREVLTTTPANTYLCPGGADLDIFLAPGMATVTITAIDHAGNESAAFTTTRIAPPHRHYNCGGGIMFAVLLVVPVIAILLAIALFIRSAIRRRKLRLEGAPIAPLVAETMTRAVIADTLFTITWGFVLVLMLYFSDDQVWAAIVTAVPVTRIVRLALVKRFLTVLERGGSAALHDNLLAANGYFVVVPDRIVKDALARSIPAASTNR